MEPSNIRNWKILEAINEIEVIDHDPFNYIMRRLRSMKAPLRNNESYHRGETFVDWNRVDPYFKFFFDREGWEDLIQAFLSKSKLAESDNVELTYLHDKLVIKIPVHTFIDDWEGFIRSTLYNGLIFLNDQNCFVEFSRDYYLHSNFEIMPNSKVIGTSV